MLLLSYWVVLFRQPGPASRPLGFMVYVWWTYCPDHRAHFRGNARLRAPAGRSRKRRRRGSVRFPTADGLRSGRLLLPDPHRRSGSASSSSALNTWATAGASSPIPTACVKPVSTSSPSTSATTATARPTPSYLPMQWVSDLELVDLQAAIDYLRSRPDRDPAGVGPLRRQPRRRHRPLRGRRKSRRLGRRHRWRIPHPRHHARLRHALGLHPLQEPALPSVRPTLDLRLRRLDRPQDLRGPPRSLSPQPGTCRLSHLPSALVHDPRPERRLHRPGNRPWPSSTTPASPARPGSSQARSTTGAAKPLPPSTANGSSTSSSATLRVTRRPDDYRHLAEVPAPADAGPGRRPRPVAPPRHSTRPHPWASPGRGRNSGR